MHKEVLEKADEQLGKRKIGKGFLRCVYDCGLYFTDNG